MTRGEGCLFVATRAGVSAADVEARPVVGAPATATWSTHRALAWTAAWMNTRGHEFLGPREVLQDRRWTMELRWHDRQGNHSAVHRPAFVAKLKGGHIAVELARTLVSKPRLRATVAEHAVWRIQELTGGVVWICTHQAAADRIVKAGASVGLSTDHGGLRVELLATLKADALTVAAGHASA